MNQTLKSITQADICGIYGTTNDLENTCKSAVDCWKEIQSFKHNKDQIPYLPYIGSSYMGILFAGVNLNGVIESLTAISDLVKEATDEYLKNKKYRIFKSESYGGSPFYYYVPLLSYLYNEYMSNRTFIENESDINFMQIVEGYQYCALTNIIKCAVNSPNKRSTPSNAMYKNCINKFSQEIATLNPKALVVFTYFNFPNLAGYMENYRPVKSGSRYRIQTNGDLYLLELEHPLSSQVTRSDKFTVYSEAMFELAKIIKSG